MINIILWEEKILNFFPTRAYHVVVSVLVLIWLQMATFFPGNILTPKPTGGLEQYEFWVESLITSNCWLGSPGTGVVSSLVVMGIQTHQLSSHISQSNMGDHQDDIQVVQYCPLSQTSG